MTLKVETQNKINQKQEGRFFTPQIIVNEIYQYLNRHLGKDWQKKYIVWDCCCGDGNLLSLLDTDSSFIASTLKHEDVLNAKKRFTNYNNGIIFQYDFLNDG